MVIKNANVFNAETHTFEKRDVFTSGSIISVSSEDSKTINANGKYVIPGLVDGHTHGRMGIDILKADRKQLEELSLKYLESGVTTVFPTVMTAPMDAITNAMRTVWMGL